MSKIQENQLRVATVLLLIYFKLNKQVGIVNQSIFQVYKWQDKAATVEALIKKNYALCNWFSAYVVGLAEVTNLETFEEIIRNGTLNLGILVRRAVYAESDEEFLGQFEGEVVLGMNREQLSIAFDAIRKEFQNAIFLQ